ncbi:MAG: L,D-transpeptidase [Hyphomicrobiales bacterium]|nr:L,D-transpeptidase [Hyphomicrobiales bacterium]
MLTGLGGLAAVTILPQRLAVAAQVRKKSQIKPGDYIWMPEVSPSGPMKAIVSLPEQLVYVYRNGVEIGLSSCSTGKRGHRTPTGVFTILEKDKHHRSSTYNNAPMPNMNRLTWSGIALHAGNLPGYPASHGCIRLPPEFSEKLFGVTHLGMAVIIADEHSAPASIVHPGQVLSAEAQAEFAHVAETKAKTPAKAQPAARIAAADVPPPRLNPRRQEQPEIATVPATAILISSVDQRIIVMDDGEIVAEGAATIAEPDKPLGHHVFVLSDVNAADRQLHWHTIGFGAGVDAQVEQAELTTIQRVRGDHEVIEAIRTRMHAGTIMVTVDQSLHEDTRTDTDFVVITTETG